MISALSNPVSRISGLDIVLRIERGIKDIDLIGIRQVNACVARLGRVEGKGDIPN